MNQYIFRTLLTCTILLFVVAGFSCQKVDDQVFDELSEEERHLPENALLGLETHEELETTLFASEDMVFNPTNMDIDEKGRIWITEGINYRDFRNSDLPGRDEGDRIVILEDTNGDGKADSEKVFYQGNDINSALGIMVLGNKVIVSRSPDVFVLTDTNGDDKADEKEILFTGIDGEEHDHGVHAFTLGPDGKLYFNAGDAGGQIRDSNGEPIIDKAGNTVKNDGNPYRKGLVFRVNLDGSEFEVLGHNFRNNYEVAVDSYGTLWQSDNDDDGNRSVRINYVMEFGNYGYTDELTGAGWRSRRINMEEDIPNRHWYQNDPGVVPNLLLTGAGSPTGILIYEGDLLPDVFHNQMIHADAGPNIIRSYPVTNNGAGYNATIENILEGVDNQWFRPSDVTVAPDGSIFVSDWYDPGVGGHRMQAPHIGRVYRIAPPETPYEIEEVDYSTPTAAIQALKSPNHAIRAKAWMQINKWGADAETELTEMYNSDNQRYRARALWLLSKIEGNGEEYINTAIEDNNPDIRIAALRAARQMDINILPLLEHLVDDASPQVLREVAIALRHNESAKAPGLWAKLALQYDGEDRWYLEALGIAADKQWDSFLEAWLAVKGDEWINEKAGRDIVWRSRAGQTLPMLVDVILNDSVEEDEKMRFFRAFDFQSSSDKEQILVDLLDEGQQDQQMITFSVLQLLDHSVLDHPKVTASLDQALETVKETADFMYLVDRYQLETKNEELVNLVLSYPDSSLGANAARHMLGYGGEGYLTELLKSNNEENVKSIIQALGYLANDQSLAILESVIVDEDMNLSSKQLAVEAFGLGRGASIRDAEDRLLKMLHDGLITSALESSAENVLMESYRADIRQAAAGYLQILNNNEATEYRPVAELIQSVGDINNGRQVFENSCQFCHQVGQEGINFGPDLTEIGDKLPKQGLYDAILDPNAGINFGYEGYILTLQNGSKVTGIRNSENDDEIDLRLPGGNSNSYDKTDIASTEIMEQSLMPNMQGSISEQEIIDLVEYLSELGSDN